MSEALQKWGWYGINREFINTHIPEESKKEYATLVRTYKANSEYLLGNKEKECALKKALTQGQGWSTTDPQGQFNKAAFPLFETAPFPLHFYIMHLVHEPHLRDATLKERIIEQQEKIETWVHTKQASGCHNFATRHFALMSKSGYVRWCDVNESLHTRTLDIFEENTHIPLSDALKHELLTLIKASERARLDIMLYTSSRTLLKESQSEWHPSIAPILSALALTHIIPLPEHAPQKMFEALVISERNDPTNNPVDVKKALETLNFLWDFFEMSQQEAVSLFALLKCVGDVRAKIQEIYKITPKKSDFTPEFVIALLGYTREYSTDGLEKYLSWLNTFTYDTRPPLFDCFLSCVSHPLSELEQAREIFTQETFSKVADGASFIEGIAAFIDLAPEHRAGVHDHLTQLGKIESITPEYTIEILSYLKNGYSLDIDYKELERFFNWLRGDDPLFERVVTFIETPLVVQKAARALIDTLFETEPPRRSLLPAVRIVTQLCEANHQPNFLVEAFEELATLPLHIREEVISRETFANMTLTEKVALESFLEEKNLVSKELIFHIVGTPQSLDQLKKMHAFLQSVETYIGYSLPQKKWFESLCEPLLPEMNKTLKKLTRARAALFEHKDSFILPRNKVESIEDALATLEQALPHLSNFLMVASLLDNTQHVTNFIPTNWIPLTLPFSGDLSRLDTNCTLYGELTILRRWEFHDGYPYFIARLTNSATKEMRSLRVPLSLTKEIVPLEMLKEYAEIVLHEYREVKGTVSSFEELCRAYNLTFTWDGHLPETVVAAALFEFYKSLKIGFRKALWSLASTEHVFSTIRPSDGHGYVIGKRLSLLPPNDATHEMPEAYTIPLEGELKSTLLETPNGEVITRVIDRNKEGNWEIVSMGDLQVRSKNCSLQQAVLELKANYYWVTKR